MDDFKKDIRNLSSFSEKLSELLKTEVDNVFPDILSLSEDDMIEYINNGIRFILSDIYTDEVFNESSLNNLLNRKINDIRKDFKRQYDLISSSYEFYEGLNKKRQKLDDYYLTNFRKHCIDCNNECNHNCMRHSSRKFLIVTENGVVKDKFKYVMCFDCKKVYPSSMIQAYCNNCSCEYFTSILERNEDPDLLPATWSKYHCEQIINKEMKCIKCSQTLYLNFKTKMLECINKKCDFQSKPNKILWTCSVCKEDFKSNAIVYNPLEVETTKRVIKQTLLTKHKAHPNRISCKCKINIFFSNFYHKKDCNGILYVGELNHKIIIVCEKCRAINFYERFIWTCPSCGVRFRDKIGYKSKDEIMRIDSMHSKDMNLSSSQQIGRSKRITKEEESPPRNKIRNRFNKKEENEEEDEKLNNNNNRIRRNETTINKEEPEEKRHSPVNRFRHRFDKEDFNSNDDNKNTNTSSKLRRNFTTQEKTQEEDTRSNRRHNIIKNDDKEEDIKEIPAQNTNKSRWERLREQREKDRNKEEYLEMKERREQMREKEKEERELREQRTRERHERMEAREKERKEKAENKKKEEENGSNYKRHLNKEKETNSNKSNNSGKSDEDNVLDIQEEEEVQHKNKHLNPRQIKQQIENIIKKGKIPEFKVEDFSLTKQLGEGSYGVIYEVSNKSRKKYAMKKIIAHDLEELDGFHQEFEFLSTCNHSNIMGIYGCCVRFLDVTTYALYVLMELAIYDWEHEIRKHLEQRQNYKEEELIDILKQIVSALKFMQTEKKIAHRDIKPQNILVFENGNKKAYKVADFGEAKEVKISKQLNTLRGTELYMSPALYDGLKKDKDDVSHDPYKSDVYSLGICFMYAAALKFNIIYETRETSDMGKIEKILHRYLKNKYTEKFIQILLLMLETEEKKRMDFVQLDKYLNENFNE